MPDSLISVRRKLAHKANDTKKLPALSFRYRRNPEVNDSAIFYLVEILVEVLLVVGVETLDDVDAELDVDALRRENIDW